MESALRDRRWSAAVLQSAYRPAQEIGTLKRYPEE